jgi:hypothetical protein
MDRELKTKNIQVVTDIPADLSPIGEIRFAVPDFQNLISNSIVRNQKPKIEIVEPRRSNSRLLSF